MAGTQELDTGQFLTYLFALVLPFFIQALIHHILPRDPIELKFFIRALVRGSPQSFKGTRRPALYKRVKRYKKPCMSKVSEGGKTPNTLRTYLLPSAIATFQVGCRVECFLRRLSCLCRPPARFTALVGEAGSPPNSYMSFDSDSFWIGVDNHASFCMANSPHLF